MYIINKIKLFINSFNIKSNFRYGYILTFILHKLDADINIESNPFISYAFSMLSLSLIALVSFIYGFGYIFSIYLLSKYDVEAKYGRWREKISALPSRSFAERTKKSRPSSRERQRRK